MDAAQRIRRLGFRKWYERELLRGHANLVLLVFATLGLLGTVEVYSVRLPWWNQLLILVGGLASLGIAYLALRHYLYRLNHAEFVAHQAVCTACQAYAKFEPLDDGAERAGLRVRCRKCGHRWEIRL